jgi:hypothetical protein
MLFWPLNKAEPAGSSTKNSTCRFMIREPGFRLSPCMCIGDVDQVSIIAYVIKEWAVRLMFDEKGTRIRTAQVD